MAKNTVFLIHGMGVHKPGWATDADGPIPTLTRAANYYANFSDQAPLSDAVEFVEISYDDIFSKILTRWAELANSISGKLPEATPDAIQKITEKLAEVDQPGNWFATHALDVALYKGFALIRRLVQLRVATTIMKTVSQHASAASGEDRKYVLIAHSLGTTVAHDSIHKMAKTAWLGNKEMSLGAVNALDPDDQVNAADLDAAIARFGIHPFGPGTFKFDAVYMIANTSRLLQTATNSAYTSVVKPMFSAGGPTTNSCRRFINIDHFLDPVGKIKRHRAEEAWPNAVRFGTAVDMFDIRHIHDVNVHALEHYLIHPLVHAGILFEIAPTRFSDEDYNSAIARLAPGGDFPTWGNGLLDEDLQDRIVAELESLKATDDAGSLINLLEFAFPDKIAQLRGVIE